MKSKIHKSLVSILCIVALISSSLITYSQAFADDSQIKTETVSIQNRYAEAAYILDLLNGNGMDLLLNKPLTRVEASALIVKLNGKFDEAKTKKFNHPFSDVPNWANIYVGYLYSNNMTNGTGNQQFGSANNTTAQSYFTFLLRVLGYDDSKSDFTYDNALPFAKSIGLIDDTDLRVFNTQGFNRYHVAKYSIKALMMPMNGTQQSLFDTLIKSGQITSIQIEQLKNAGWHVERDQYNNYSLKFPSVFIEDKVFEKILRSALAQPTGELSKTSLEQIISLNALQENIESIEGIQYCVNLKYIYFEISNIKDVSPLRTLKNLVTVTVDYALITDTNALDYLVESEKLQSVTMRPRTQNMNLNTSMFNGRTGLEVIVNNRVYLMDAYPLTGKIDFTKEQLALKNYIPDKACNYLILIEDSSQLESVLAFYEAKKNEGYHVAIQSVSSISSTFGDKFDRIRQYLVQIDNKYDLRYVLLVGNPYNPKNASQLDTGGNIPMLYFHQSEAQKSVFDGSSNYFNNSILMFNNVSNIPTDVLYSIKNDWKGTNFEALKNAENLFTVGRIPFSNPETIDYVLENTMNYKPKGSQTKTLLAGGFYIVPPEGNFSKMPSGDTSANLEKVKNNLSKYNMPFTTLYEQNGILKAQFKSDFALSLDEVNKQFPLHDVLFLIGHGGTTGYYWEKDTNKNKKVDDQEIGYNLYFDKYGLTNQVKFLFQSGCSTAVVERQENEAMTHYNQTDVISLMAQGKIVSGVGTGRDIWFDPKKVNQDILCSFDLYDGKYSIAEIFRKMQLDLWNNSTKTTLSLFDSFYYNYFGDPSIKY